MLSLKMNDAAIQALGFLAGLTGATPPGGLAPGLRDQLASGIGHRGDLLTWADSASNTDSAPSFFGDLTNWECSASSFRLEDHVPVRIALVDGGTPQITEDDQRTLLLHGIAFALEFGRLVYGLDRPAPSVASSPRTRPMRPSGSTRSAPASSGTTRTSTDISWRRWS